MHPSLTATVEFVEGLLEPEAFARRLYEDAGLEEALSDQQAPKYAHTGHTLYHYLIALNYCLPGDVLTAQGALAEFLKRMNVLVTPSKGPSELFDLVLSAQPRWLNVDAAVLQNILAEIPSLENRGELRKWLRARMLERYRYVKKPPVWLQAPNWPLGKNGPLVFLGQISVEGYFHDAAAAYVFHDPELNQCTTVLQTR
jgi:hypothetical protein